MNDGKRVQEIFLAALEVPNEQRDAWLVKRCRGDERLLREVRSLLKHDSPDHDPLEKGFLEALEGPGLLAQENVPGSAPSEPDLNPMDSDLFFSKLSEVGVLSPEEIRKLDRQVASGQGGADPRKIASRLVAEGRLTEFQATALLKGQPELLIDKYLIIDLLEAGGMGMVFKAVHRPMNRTVALKMISQHLLASPEQVRRFQREVRVAATLEHPNIVRSYDADQSRGVHFLVMEYVRGENLSRIVQREGPMSVDKAVDCIRQAAKGLQYAQTKGVIHRDIKPGNLMLNGEGTLKVLDLGLASMDESFRFAQQNLITGDQREPSIRPRRSELTIAGTVLGTAAFMAPEQSHDARTADSRSDIYSLGCTLHYLLTGEAPYEGDSLLQILMQHREGEIPRLGDKRSDVSQEIEAIFRRMLAKSPANRFQSMNELLAAIEACGILSIQDTAGGGGASPPVNRPWETTRQHAAIAFKSRRRRRHLMTIALLVALGGMVYWFYVSNVAGPMRGVTNDKRGSGFKRDVLAVNPQAKGRQPGAEPVRAIAPFTKDAARLYQTAWADYLEMPVEFKNSIGMTIRVIPAGEFRMGSPNAVLGNMLEEAKRSGRSGYFVDQIRWEGPQHKVVITRPFGIGVCEVTLGQFREFVEETDYKTDAEIKGLGGMGYRDGRFVRATVFLWNSDIGFEDSSTDNHPVVNVSWNDAVAFCEWLSRKEQALYRLPTEAEWEFACRAGSATLFHFGDTSEDLDSFGRYWKGPRGTDRVGQRKANAFGLFDMHGNVWEWCSDTFGPYSSEDQVNPTGPASGEAKVNRGGSWDQYSQNLRSAFRVECHHSDCNYVLGFRVVRELKPAQES